MSSTHEQIAALDNLLRWYSEALSPFGHLENGVAFDMPEIPTDHPAYEEIKSEAAEIFSRLLTGSVNAMNGIEAAKRRLLASGYPVPDHWITVNSVKEPNNPLKSRRDTDSGKTMVRFRVIVKDVDRGQLERICEEIYAAKLRAEFAPVAPAEPDTKTDTTKKTKKNPLPRNADVLRLAQFMRREWKRRPNETKTSLAIEYADGDKRKAESLLRKLRDYPDLIN